jgi:hypothetical protein
MSPLHAWLIGAYVVIFVGFPWLAWYWSQTGPNQMNEMVRKRYMKRALRG